MFLFSNLGFPQSTMGGTTQSKFAFISTTIKMKEEELNKSKAAEEVKADDKAEVRQVLLNYLELI